MTTQSASLVTAMHLVDEMLDCRSQLQDDVSAGRRAELETVLADRAALIRQYLDALDD